MIVDDSEMNREILVSMLEDEYDLIQADSSDDNIGRAYKLGVNDYFSRPFDAAVVLRRVHNTIALHDKYMGNFQDTLGMLSDFYYVILKVNLTTDSYLILKDGFDDQEKYFDSFTSFSGRLRGFADMDCIYEDDNQIVMLYVRDINENSWMKS